MSERRVEAKDRAAWRKWLRENHRRAEEIWLVYYKQDSGVPSVSYMESLEEALCFGWIDGVRKKVDARRYMHRFSPRRPGSKWSPRNLEIAERLLSAGKMAAAGKKAYAEREEYRAKPVAQRADPLNLDPEFERAIRKNEKAWKFLQSLAPSYRKRYVLWLNTAKRPETRAKRLQEVIASLAAGQKPGMK